MTKFWIAFGLIGQAVFASRFVLQWLASERAHRSIVPREFWVLSIAGSLLLLTYAIYRQDPVFILGQAGGLFIYMRNITLLVRERKLG